MNLRREELKNEVIVLRKRGKTYGEIQKIVGLTIPKSTLSYWCNGVILSKSQKEKIEKHIIENIGRGRRAALLANKYKREKYLKSVENRIKHLKRLIKNRNVAKIALSMLYLGEGTKSHRGSLIFGNSDHKIIRLFLELLRYCYNIDEKKFRCTLQCRADQNIKVLERFWSKITGIPLKQFYKAQVDHRTIGKPSKKPDYKGVCRIDYFSADTYTEIMKIAEII